MATTHWRTGSERFTGDTRAQSIDIALAQPGEDSVGRVPIGLALLRESSRHPIVKCIEALNIGPLLDDGVLLGNPFLRWAGSKKQLVQHLISYWPGGDARYVEPFAGSARLFFRLEPHSALLGDINSGLIEAYQVVRDRPHELHRALVEWANEEGEYYRVRALDPAMMTQTTRVARFIYLNRFCFNGLYRTNRAGRFNVPYGGHKSGRLPSLGALDEASVLLERAELIAGDFASVLRRVEKGDFVYLDPPFSVQSRRVFREYGPASFGPTDLLRMRAALQDLDRLGATFLLSYAESDEGEELASGFHSCRVTTKRHIAGFVASRRSATELLVTNSPQGNVAGSIDGH